MRDRSSSGGTGQVMIDRPVRNKVNQFKNFRNERNNRAVARRVSIRMIVVY